MMSEHPNLNPQCSEALEALEKDPLVLSAPVEAHLAGCAPCSEARVLWLAMDEAPAVEVPTGYFEGLSFRILRKLPGRRAGFGRQASLWLAAAGLVAAFGLGATGFFMGRASRPPVVEASQPKGLADAVDQQVETPFVDTEDPVHQLSDLTPQEAESALQRLQSPPPAQPKM